MTTLVRRAAVAALLIAASSARADDAKPDAAPDLLATARAAYQAVIRAKYAVPAAGKDEEKRRAAIDALSKAADEWNAAFAATDWSKRDQPADKPLLFDGLNCAGGIAVENGDGATAVRAFELMEAKFAGFGRAILRTALPAAYCTAGDTAKAIASLEKTVSEVKDDEKPAFTVVIGDIRAATGDLDGARAAWKSVVDGVPEDPAPKGDGRTLTSPPKDPDAPAPAAPGPKRDPRLPARATAVRRLARIGADAPDIDSSKWLGAEQGKLSAHKGEIVVLLFFSTWSLACRGKFPELSKLAAAHPKDGLTVLGVTRYYDTGGVPKPGTKDLLEDADMQTCMSHEDFEKHLAVFRGNAAVAWPFVIADKSDFDAYGVKDLPTVFVIGRDGKVAFAGDGGSSDPIFRLCVRRLAAEK